MSYADNDDKSFDGSKPGNGSRSIGDPFDQLNAIMEAVYQTKDPDTENNQGLLTILKTEKRNILNQQLDE